MNEIQTDASKRVVIAMTLSSSSALNVKVMEIQISAPAVFWLSARLF